MLIWITLFVLIILGYFYNIGSGGISSAGFSYGDDSVTFDSGGLRTDYLDIIRVERDIASCEHLGIKHFGYLITYRDKNKKVKQFIFYKSINDNERWGYFKVKMLYKNPKVIVSESVL